MIRRSGHEPPDDERIDRMLQAAMLVEPSRHLPARVRACVAAEPLRPARRGPWIWAGAAAVVLLVLALASGSPGKRQLERSVSVTIGSGPNLGATAPAPRSLASDADAAPDLPADPDVGRAARALVATPAASEDARPAAALVEQLAPQFDLREREAFLQFLSISRAGDLPPFDVTEPAGAEDDLAVPAIEISTIDILPVMAGGIEGEPQ